MRFLVFAILFFGISMMGSAQSKLDRALKKFNTESVPYIHVDAIVDETDMVLLDTRKLEEYRVSHLQNAIWVGHRTFQQEAVIERIPDKDTPIVVYCSIGVRSEDIGEQLQKAGYTNVQNLYGGIFEWKNQGRAVYNTSSQETDSIHAFNKHWGKLLNKGIKIYTVPKSTTAEIE